MSKRTDPHRPGAIVPADYDYLISYSLPGSTMRRGVNMEALAALPAEDFFKRPMGGRCDVCGAHFIHGDVWRHRPTDKLLHFGHDCADKYTMLAERLDWSAKADAERRWTAAQLEHERRVEARQKFLDDHPGLKDLLLLDHPVIQNIRESFERSGWCSLTVPQIELVRKIADQLSQPKTEEQKIAHPTGRIEFEGEIVSAKWHDSQYGGSLKMTVKVTTPEGIWLAWGSVPKSVTVPERGLRGYKVRLTATLESGGRDSHFCFFKRPTSAKLLDVVPEVQATVE